MKGVHRRAYVLYTVYVCVCVCSRAHVCKSSCKPLMAVVPLHTQNTPPSLSNNPAGASASSVFPPIFFYVLFAFPKQDESGDGSIQRSFIFRRGAISKTQEFIQYKHILVQRALV